MSNELTTESISFIKLLYHRNRSCFGNFPNKAVAEDFAIGLFDFLFASYQEKFQSVESLSEHYLKLQADLSLILNGLLKDNDLSESIAQAFFKSVPSIYDQLMGDANATLAFDPAAKSLDEVLIAYPGFFATAIYRISHALHLLEVPVLPRILSEFAHGRTGIDIHPGATIGGSFTIDHGTGIVIGETATIGNQVKLYQGVTLGAINVDKELAQQKRHPTIEDNVVIYSGATILGGSTVIGKGAVIGGNVWLTQSVAPNSVVYHKSEMKVKGNTPFEDILDFVI